ncbi:MAG: GNAT family N-acetyltransferase [Oscillatoriales cyanobacterium RM1_1_9]|nr:GNAT family N-acetyltransferase [Oscillatoriales cyanobacterium SM2_3_0]NJO47386.1 GNAT family N-acetyltransferase [Oscillatoriales cyanobacterium RM2_1_1]NJO71355.1 GNAT family N-acetyltransferase [Oscillatoriales cyanobacterium RM1_1_9]
MGWQSRYKVVDTLTHPQIEEWMAVNSDYCFGICDVGTDQLIGFARVLSAQVYRAFIYDVIATGNYRGQGLGRRLMEQIVSHPDLSQVECIQLFCLPEMMAFYQRFNFDLTETEQVLLVQPKSSI